MFNLADATISSSTPSSRPSTAISLLLPVHSHSPLPLDQIRRRAIRLPTKCHRKGKPTISRATLSRRSQEPTPTLQDSNKTPLSPRLRRAAQPLPQLKDLPFRHPRLPSPTAAVVPLPKYNHSRNLFRPNLHLCDHPQLLLRRRQPLLLRKEVTWLFWNAQNKMPKHPN